MARFEQKVNLQTQNLSSGAAGGLMALGDTFQQIAAANIEKRTQRVIEDQTQAGQQAFKRGEKPTFMDEDRLIGGVSAKAYNNGLRAAYSASISNDVRESLAQIELDNPNDVGAFKSKVDAHRAALVKEVDPAVLPDVLARFDQHTTNGAIRVRSAGELVARNNASATILGNIDSLANESAAFARSGDLKASGQTMQEAFKVIDDGVVSGVVEAHKAAGMKRTIELRATQENIIGLTRGFINNGETDKALAALEAIRDKPVKGFTIDEQNNLMSEALSDITLTLNLKDKREGISDQEASEKQEAASQDMYVRLVGGDLNGQDVVEAMRNNVIDQAQGNKLISTLNTQGSGVDDIGLINNIQRMIDNNESPQEISRLISANVGGRLTQATAGDLMSAQSSSVADGSPLKSESYKSAINYMEEMIAPKGFMGRFDIESGKRFALLNREARERVLAGEEPWAVIDSLIPKDALLKTGMNLEGKYNGADSQAAMMTALDGEAVSQQLKPDEFNAAVHEIKTYWEQLNAYNATRESVKGATR